MHKKRILLGILGLAAAGSLAYATGTMAYRGNPDVQGPNYTQYRHEQMEKAFENNDYPAWKNLMNGRGRVMQVVNEDNFNRFAEAHRLAEEGQIAEANQIRQELGLGLGGQNRGQNQGDNFIDKDKDGICDRLQ